MFLSNLENYMYAHRDDGKRKKEKKPHLSYVAAYDVSLLLDRRTEYQLLSIYNIIVLIILATDFQK